VLFYGSCLREATLDGLMLDFYLIVDDYAAAYDRRWLATANRWIPPNVFPFAKDALSAKYAVLSMADLARECSMDARSVSVWARFAQPCRLAWVHDTTARDAVVAAVADAGRTLFTRTLPMCGADAAPLDIWRRGFALTYGAELRAERGVRSQDIVAADADRYERFGAAIRADLAAAGGDAGTVSADAAARARREWRWLQRKGKLLTIARLAKATFTFAGGIDYLAWKINRHAGTQISISPWQRRHPIAAALLLLPRLLRQGAVK
jgi:hypothetical protein